jgi:hypothetical protein
MQQTNDFIIAFHVGAVQARQAHQPTLTGDPLLFLALCAYSRASQTLNLNCNDFLIGWVNGWDAWYGGIIAESEV